MAGKEEEEIMMTIKKKIFKDNPIFGQGPKAFRMLCKKKDFFVPGACTTHPHNTILQILSEIGLVGIVFYLIILMLLKTKS